MELLEKGIGEIRHVGRMIHLAMLSRKKVVDGKPGRKVKKNTKKNTKITCHIVVYKAKKSANVESLLISSRMITISSKQQNQ